ncbi:MAG TPA: DUF2059 domain-containing protein [Polyangiaceae bacterium]|nr:DUF2059 domain-containing protein [Polyangiaceae bacterium]
MRRIVAVLVLAASSAALSLAVENGPAQAKGSEDLAMTLSKIVLSDEIYSQTLQQVTAGMAQGMAASMGSLPPDFAEKMEKVMRDALPRKEMLEFNAQVYGSRFSDPELQQIIDFYKTPTGGKILREMPGISRDVMLKIGQIMPQRLPGLMKKHGLIPQGKADTDR